MAARMSSEAEAAALLEATTTTVATAAAALEAEAAKPDELQLEIEAARAKARAAQDKAEPQEADAAPAPVIQNEKPPLTEDARSLVDRAAPIEVLQDNPKKVRDAASVSELFRPSSRVDGVFMIMRESTHVRSDAGRKREAL